MVKNIRKRIDAFLHEQVLRMLPLILGALVYGIVALTVTTMPPAQAKTETHR